MANKGDYPNSGILLRDDKRDDSNPKDRTHRGDLNSGWVREGRMGRFVSLAFKPKEPRRAGLSSAANVTNSNDEPF